MGYYSKNVFFCKAICIKGAAYFYRFVKLFIVPHLKEQSSQKSQDFIYIRHIHKFACIMRVLDLPCTVYDK